MMALAIAKKTRMSPSPMATQLLRTVNLTSHHHGQGNDRSQLPSKREIWGRRVAFAAASRGWA